MKGVGLASFKLVALAVAILCAAGAWGAQEQLSAPADAVDLSGFGPAEPEQGMERQSGRQGLQIDRLSTVINSNESNGYLGQNYLQSHMTGANNLSDNAFSNASGIATVIQNTGNQVLIQNSTILNLTMQ